MHLIDIRTLLLVITLALVCRAAVLAYVWRIERQYAPIRYWTAGSIAIAAGVLLVGLRDIAPPLISILLAQALIVSGWLLVAGGSVAAAGRTPPWRAGILLALATVAGVAWYLLVTPDFGARTIVITVPAVIMDVYAAIACLRASGSARATTLRLLGSLLLVEAASNLWKMIIIVGGGIDSIAGSGAATMPFYLVALVSIIVGTVLFVLLAAQTLQEELDREIRERVEREKTLRLASLVFENSGESMMVTDADGVILNVNPAFTALTGYTADEAIGKTPRILKSDRQDAAFYEALWRDLLTTGAWQGELWNRHKNGELFAERLTINSIRRPDGTIERRVALFHDITAQKQSAEVIYRQAHFDALTALPNRYFFFDQLSKELSRARRTKGRVGLLFMDLNKFKPVNDLYGHDAGDQVLKIVAERWLATTRSSDTLARLGGDEFALIVGGLNDPAELNAIADKLITALSAPIPLPRGATCMVGTSVGGSIYPDNATEMDSLIAAADAAMYDSKAGGEGRFARSHAESASAEDGGDWLIFDESHLIGVDSIDEQHRQLVRMVNQINRAVKDGRSEQELQTLVSGLVAYAAMHFETEHTFMLEHGYPDRAAHDEQHRELLAQVGNLANRFAAGDELKLLQTIKDWLIGHILHADKPLGAFLSARGLK